ncbi:cytochrome c biogenesis protein ResB [Nocardioides sp. zg-DK7169]|uniref:cytochrome c biogenesis protein ResB n=1 Tax=Nocardioides sp. zg-DK7169 TaxID=2736600 RepID=UPI001554A062|nr:cytochrome c biogenesis protein ResB [Nocardioides sp. zg-DK7169]NPC98557.1 cytochrome c biogenesis protein ResB [Nocardioides sp. zg-DK7169]
MSSTSREPDAPEAPLDTPASPGGPGDSGDSGGRSGRGAGELGVGELLRWVWRQVTSMRTALILLLLLALAAVPGSIIPQEGVDSLATSQWKDEHPDLTPVYEWLGLFDVYGTVWFSAIYILLMLSLIGCILPRTFHYLKAIRKPPPRAPRNLGRLPDHASYTTDESVDEVLAKARRALRGRRYRVRPAALDPEGEDAVASEKGYLREVGNLIFHVSVIVVLVGFAAGSLFGYRGGVLLVVGNGFSNSLTQYDDFVPGDLFDADEMEPFSFTVDDFDVEWLTTGPRAGMAQKFNAALRYKEAPDAEEKEYDLRVNHPLAIGDTEVFLIGHGYAPVITIRDGNGDVTYSGPTIFLPQDMSLFSFGVVKAPDSPTGQVGLEGVFYPTFSMTPDGDPVNVFGDLANPLLSVLVYTGDLGLDDGVPQSVYVLPKTDAEQVTNPDGTPLRLDMQPGDTVRLPDDLGSVTFDGVERWNRLQISQTPGKMVALTGVVLALVGLLGSLFIRPRRVWVRARREGGATLVEVAALDRSGGGDVTAELEALLEALEAPEAPAGPDPARTTPHDPIDPQNQTEQHPRSKEDS